jgi:tetrahydromethanopterin S-methyltransferase subunit H
MWDFKGWAGADAVLEGLAAFLYHDTVFSGPIAGAGRIFPAVAMAEAYLATAVFSEIGELPKKEGHPIHKLFPDFVTQLKEM